MQHVETVKLDVLTAWEEPGTGRVFVGNVAAAMAGVRSDLEETSDLPPDRPEVWADELVIAPGGRQSPVRLRIGQADLVQPLRNLFATFLCERVPQTTLDLIVEPHRTGLWNGDQCVSFAEPEVHGQVAELDVLQALLIAWYETAGLIAIVHGACVAWQGRRIALVGRSGAGKSTFAAQMVARHEAQWVTDDTVLLARRADEGRSVLPFPQRPRLKSGAWPLLETDCPGLHDAPERRRGGIRFRELLDAEFCGAPALPGPEAFVFLRHKPEAVPRLVELTLDEAVLRFVRSGVRIMPGKLPEFVDHLRSARLLAMEHPDVAAGRDMIADALGLRGV